jgi:hypothetical protein
MNPASIRWTQRLALGALLAASVTSLVFALRPRTSEAVPAFARRYGVDCKTCHAPQPPRLNNVGMLFQASGFRLPDADANGKYMLKNIPATGVGDAASLNAEFNAHILDKSEVTNGENRTSMEMGEVALIAGSAIGEHYSSHLHFLLRNDTGDPEFEAAQVQANYGKPDREFYVKAGLTEPLAWQKVEEGSITLSKALALGEDPMGAVGSFAGFPIGLTQTLMEAGGILSNLNHGSVRATLVSASLLNGVSQDPTTGELMHASTNPTDGTDYLLQATELIGDRNTLGVFYYGGRTLYTNGVTNFKDHFDRFGVVGSLSPVERLELVGGIINGQDKTEELAAKAKALGGFAEADVEIVPGWVGAYRFDQVDPNTDVGGDLRRAHTLTSRNQVLTNLFLIVEYQQRIEADDSRPHDLQGQIRFTY